MGFLCSGNDILVRGRQKKKQKLNKNREIMGQEKRAEHNSPSTTSRKY